jgi:hypothetical protein
MVHHKRPKLSVIFCIEGLKFGTAIIKVPFGFSNRFNSLIFQIRNVFQTCHIEITSKNDSLIRWFLQQMKHLSFAIAFAFSLGSTPGITIIF